MHTKTMKRLAVLAAIAACSIQSAQAAGTGPYAEVGGSGGQNSQIYGQTDDTALLGSLLARAGYDFNPYLAAELEMQAGVRDDIVSLADGTEVDLTQKARLGAYAIAKWPFYGASVFGRVGYARNQTETIGPSGTDERSESQVEAGLGLTFDVIRYEGYVRADLTRTEEGDTSASLTFGWRF